ncbi:hypothetical protein C3Y89_24515 [Rhizobium sp. UPM1132]|uniref:hypothetical protein n=1 Tax=Rhizobium ruizarguesonis TaxID=2081791 RepID=UPI0014474312|nr:hypothetical protein [Rhizobium ruizarguesonis]NKQ73461.1 hypothetical protein [Rhizobium ruizarguesonis]
MRISLVAFYLLLFVTALLPTGVFAYWLYRRPWDLKDKISAWDPFVKTMAIAGAVIVGLATFERFLDQRQQEIVKDMVARAQSRNEAFSQATNTASAIANASDLNSGDTKEAVASFWKLYWGELARFEGPAVEGSMVEFGRSLQTWQKTGEKPQEMVQLSLAVSHACRSEIEAYDKQMDELRNRYSPFSSYGG